MESMKLIHPRSDRYVDWSEAYSRVENFFCSLRIRNKLLLSQLVAKILERAAKVYSENPDGSPTVIALREARNEVDQWFEQVLDAAGVDSRNMRAKGRLALNLADMPQRWQNEFLHPGPWPEAFLESMRTTYLNTGPGFQVARMRPREIDLGPISAIADETWRVIERWPVLGTAIVWSIYLGGIFLLFYLTR